MADIISGIVAGIMGIGGLTGLFIFACFAYKAEQKRIKRALDLKERQVVALEKMAGEK